MGLTFKDRDCGAKRRAWARKVGRGGEGGPPEAGGQVVWGRWPGAWGSSSPNKVQSGDPLSCGFLLCTPAARQGQCKDEAERWAQRFWVCYFLLLPGWWRRWGSAGRDFMHSVPSCAPGTLWRRR